MTGRAQFRHAVAVRWRDLDSMGHAHNTLPLVYFEEARARYWREVVGRGDVIDYVIAGVTVRFHARIRWPDTLDVALGIARIGERSFTMDFTISSADGTLVASGESTQVMYDFDADHSTLIPADVRAVLEAYAAAVQDSR